MFSPDMGQQFLSDLRAACGRLNPLSLSNSSYKSDNSLVTEIDTILSDFCKHHPTAQGFHFYSEEEHSSLTFPAMIVDPIDGTRELVVGRPESAVSVAWMKSPDLKDGHAIIFNPFTGFSLTSHETALWAARELDDEPTGMVSRSEWEKGLYQDVKLKLTPRGSIAFKLALLASGSCDFVVSRKPKNIWDIAAGTILCHQRGFELWSAGKKVTKLDQATLPAPLVWARPHLIPSLRAHLSF